MVTRSILRPVLRPLPLLLMDDGPQMFAETMRRLVDVSAMYLRKVDANAFGIGLMQSNGKLAEWSQRKDGDGFLLLRGAFCGTTPTFSSYIKPTLAGAFTTASANSYTTVVGATASFSFSGTGFYFRHYADNRGGLWKFTVDGVDVATISTWADPAVAGVETLICSGLVNATHSVVATFMGADPGHAPTGGVARGWILYDYNSAGSNSSAKVTGPLYVSGVGAGAVDIISKDSIPDFAIAASKQGSGMSSTWVPRHSDAGAARNIVASLMVDGVSVNTDPNVLSANIEFTDAAVFLQTYTAYNGNDVPGDYPMWDGVIVHRYDRNGLTVTHSIDFKYGNVNADGYLAMLPSKVGNAEKLITNAGESVTIAASDVSVPFARFASSAAYINATTGNGCAIDVNLSQVLAPTLTDPFFYTIRLDDVTKAYWKKVSGTVTTGTQWQCVNRYSAVAGATFPAAWTS